MPFIPGQSYTRDQIHEEIGGELVSYLPESGGRVVCACLDPQLDPQAPRVILPGNGPGIMRKADKLMRQLEPVHVFLKRGTGDWVYRGEWVTLEFTKARDVIREHASLVGRTDVTSVIWMRPLGELVDADDLATVRAALKEYVRECASHRTSFRLARRSTHWVHDTASGEFAPAMFVAFEGMTWTMFDRLREPPDEARAVATVSTLMGATFQDGDELKRRFAAWATRRLPAGATAGREPIAILSFRS